MSFFLPSPPPRGLPAEALAISEGARLASESVVGPGTPMLAHYRSLQIQASLYVKPATLEPVLLQPVHQPQLIVQLTGTTRLRLIQQGVASSYQTGPGSVHLNTAQQLPYELAWQSPAEELIQSLHISLDPTLLHQTATAAGFDADRLELLAGTCLEAPLLQQLGYSLAAALQAPVPADSLYVDTVALMLATQLVHRHSAWPSALPPSRAGLAPGRLQQIRDYVHASLHQPITLESLAATACLSPYHFCRAFKRATGQSPHQYVISQRLERARQLLQRGHHSVGQVARAVSYHSTSHFTRLYQRHLGMLPSELLPPARS